MPRLISLGEAETPVTTLEWCGTRLLLKLEGALPTGSFKDRGTAVLFGTLADHGVREVVEDSSGNAGASFSAYAAACGVELELFVPGSVSPAKLLQATAHGARVRTIEGPRAAATSAAVAASQRSGAIYASHQWQPAFNLGTQTFAFELWEQLGQSAPDVVVCPVGAGGLLLGVCLGFRALEQAGLIERRPRVIGVQSAACAPLALAMSSGADDVAPLDPGQSIADGVLIAHPPRSREILAAVRDSGGAIVTADDPSVWAAHDELRRRGLLVETTSALAVAAIEPLLAAGLLTRDAQVVVAITGHGLKSASRLGERLGARV